MNILQTIGHTPLVQLTNSTAVDEGRVFLKYERNNPGGSIKDRPALYIIEQAEKLGLLKPGGTIIESSSGNFGISLAMIGAVKGYHVIILVDPKTTSTNLALLKSFGAEVIVVTQQDDSGSYHKTRISLANQMAREIKNSFRPDQCFNVLNRQAHYKNTAQEILDDCNNEIDMIITAVSTGGQLGGISKYIKEHMPSVKIVGVDAEGSAIFGGEAHAYRIPGVGLGWTPSNLDLSLVDCAYKVDDELAFITARALARHEGILTGPSSGACVAVALKYAQTMGADARIVCIGADGGERYIHTLFNDDWMQEQNFRFNMDICEIKKMALGLRPWSDNPISCANYHTDLLDALDVPASTRMFNNANWIAEGAVVSHV